MIKSEQNNGVTTTITNMDRAPIYIQINNSKGLVCINEGHSYEVFISSIKVDPEFVYNSNNEIKRLKKKVNRILRKVKK